MSFPVSVAAAAALPAVGFLAKGLKQVASSIPFSLGANEPSLGGLSERTSELASAGVASESPALNDKLANILKALRDGMKQAGVDSNQRLEVSADGDQRPKIDSDDLEAAQFADSWFREHPEQTDALNSVVRSLRSGGPSSEVLGKSSSIDPRRQTLKIDSSPSSFATQWDAGSF